MPDLAIRPATVTDAQAVCEIYAHHVAHSTGTFDITAPDVAAWEAKIGAIAERGWPLLVAEHEGAVAGYCYCTQLREREAYARTCEDSIYVRPGMEGQGIGKRLLTALIAAARDCGFEQMIAVLGGAGPVSAALHAACGFVEVGRLRNVGFKFGRRLDTLYMQRDLTREDRPT
ncbi:MAG: N-acetyltransferase family protein [Erythrobacter sp.]|uniref:GNAT family N-acetyltransferase n=1 Tax=Erythrobacter sp. TaxID=1042 RepID=UPI002B4675C8|nr:GNAT family N-acetyltransferase [Erythrobacter sp.]WRH71175.1 MAG: N-acetyltransferase family protein [Erythrobacter sp.]